MRDSLDRMRSPARDLFRKHPGNPILEPTQWPYAANAVFNPGAAVVDGKTVLLVRVEDLRGFSHFTVARTPDGVGDWEVEAAPTLEADPDHLEEECGLEDPRIVWLEDELRYAITYVCFSRGGPIVSLATTTDFRHYTWIGPLVPPEDKDASILPRKVQGRYVLIHRPIVRGEAHIWISFSPDLRHWGGHRVLLPVRPGWWDGARVGLGPPPIETPEGWLLIYHGVRITTASSLYRVGLALLDLERPWIVLRRSAEWVLGPQEPYELRGDVPGVVFPTGAIWNQVTDELRLYYGAADRVVGLATARVAELLDYLRRSPAG